MDDERNNAEQLGPQLSDELKQFAAELSRLQPREDRLDRERLAFLAGQASVSQVVSMPAGVAQLHAQSKVWRAGFAAMSAVAASLLFLLVTRPEMPSVSSGGSGDRVQIKGQNIAERRVGGSNVLTTQDVRSDDLEQRLAKLEVVRKDAGPALSSESPSARVLTPAGWQQVIRGLDEVKSMPRKSSSVSQTQGVNT